MNPILLYVISLFGCLAFSCCLSCLARKRDQNNNQSNTNSEETHPSNTYTRNQQGNSTNNNDGNLNHQSYMQTNSFIRQSSFDYYNNYDVSNGTVIVVNEYQHYKKDDQLPTYDECMRNQDETRL